MSNNAAITGWGAYSPTQVLNNQDLEKLVATTDHWIRTRTGIVERHVAGPGETTATMCTRAAQKALEKAQLAAADLDLILCATTTPDHLIPATACLVQHALGAHHAGAFDINSACTGFLNALVVASQFIKGNTCQRILVTAGETLSRFLDWQDRNTCVLFGDGAAAVVLESTSQDAGILSSVLGSRGDVEKLLTIEAGGCAHPASLQTVQEKAHMVRMRGNELFKAAVRAMTTASLDAIARAGLDLKDIRAVIPHQANSRIITAIQEALNLDPQKVFVNVDRHGNTGSTSVPIALAEFADSQPLAVGDHLLLVSFGGGLTWAATVLRWANIPAIQKERTRPAVPFPLKKNRPLAKGA